ncbi:MAG: hypothetical protein K6F96_05705 [Bacteroidales bacterium]|nr:hypothetical protein [Bacteroidales bacterium]
MKKKHPEGEVVKDVSFQNKAVIFQGNGHFVVLNNPVLGKIKTSKGTRKYTTETLPQFCPFCGKPLYEKDEEEGGSNG